VIKTTQKQDGAWCPHVKIGASAVIYADIPNMAVVAMKPGFEILSINGNQP